jgi:hypothetical protein
MKMEKHPGGCKWKSILEDENGNTSWRMKMEIHPGGGKWKTSWRMTMKHILEDESGNTSCRSKIQTTLDIDCQIIFRRAKAVTRFRINQTNNSHRRLGQLWLL